MSDEKLIYTSGKWMYALFRAPDGTLSIEVCVGGAAMYLVRVRLTPEEAAAYARKGSAFTDQMAEDILSNPGFNGRAET